ncbi:MAG: hypothetical protein ACYTXY_50025, partial [Nostoc sp.]
KTLLGDSGHDKVFKMNNTSCTMWPIAHLNITIKFIFLDSVTKEFQIQAKASCFHNNAQVIINFHAPN